MSTVKIERPGIAKFNLLVEPGSGWKNQADEDAFARDLEHFVKGWVGAATVTVVPDVLAVEPSTCDGDYFLTVDIDPDDPYGSFKKLPAGLEYEGRIYGKSGYNSDKNRAYYKAGMPLARRVK